MEHRVGAGHQKGKHRRQTGKPGMHRSAAGKPSGKPTYDDWVWWPNAEGRRSRAAEEFYTFPPDVQGELLARIERLLLGETRYKDVDSVGDGISELRYRTKNNHYRILFFTDGRTCVGLTCFFKNQQRTEKDDLDRAKKRRRQY